VSLQINSVVLRSACILSCNLRTTVTLRFTDLFNYFNRFLLDACRQSFCTDIIALFINSMQNDNINISIVTEVNRAMNESRFAAPTSFYVVA